MLEFNVDNKGDNKPNSLNKAIQRANCLKWKDAMQTEYISPIKNKIYKLMPMLENRQVIMGQCCFKLKKDCNKKILKYKAR